MIASSCGVNQPAGGPCSTVESAGNGLSISLSINP